MTSCISITKVEGLGSFCRTFVSLRNNIVDRPWMTLYRLRDSCYTPNNGTILLPGLGHHGSCLGHPTCFGNSTTRSNNCALFFNPVAALALRAAPDLEEVAGNMDYMERQQLMGQRLKLDQTNMSPPTATQTNGNLTEAYDGEVAYYTSDDTSDDGDSINNRNNNGTEFVLDHESGLGIATMDKEDSFVAIELTHPNTKPDSTADASVPPRSVTPPRIFQRQPPPLIVGRKMTANQQQLHLCLIINRRLKRYHVTRQDKRPKPTKRTSLPPTLRL